SSTTGINFPTGRGTQLIDNLTHQWDDATSTKQNFSDEVVILVSSTTGSTWTGVSAGTNPVPVELAFFAGTLNGNNVELRWRTETEVNNYGFDIERTKDNSDWLTIGFVEGHGNSNSPKQYNFTDADIGLSGNYYYRLKQIDNDGTYEYSDVVSVEVGVPNNFYLSQNYPNPFNPETRIDFTLPEKQIVSLRVYNTLGELVKELVNEQRGAGSYSEIFDASKLPSGVYIYRLQASELAENKKMTLIK
ncbi:MAG: T9SS type A sorting domain-containing protein, partial [Ignavibacteriaceae bacterium]